MRSVVTYITIDITVAPKPDPDLCLLFMLVALRSTCIPRERVISYYRQNAYTRKSHARLSMRWSAYLSLITYIMLYNNKQPQSN